MVRIIAGEFRGRKIDTPKDDRIRPTTDRVKESLFNIMQNKIAGRRILDLFAGTGNLGLEALSRGASYVIFVDNDFKNEDLLNSNIKKLGADVICRVMISDYERAVLSMANRGVKFDLVFMDPPYKLELYEKALNILFTSKILNSDGIVTVEHLDSRKIADVDGLYKVYDRRKYGNTAISFVMGDNDEKMHLLG